MNSVNSRDLSEYLNSMVRAGMLRQDMAEELNKLPTKEQQRQAFRRLPDACLKAARGVVRDLQLESAPHPAHDEAPQVEEPVPAASSPRLRRQVGGILVGLVILGLIFHENVLQTGSDWIYDLRSAMMPVPQILDVYPVVGNKLYLRWTPLGKNYGYRIYRCRRNGQRLYSLINGAVYTSAAVVNVRADGEKEAWVAVTAVNRPDEDVESHISGMAGMALNPRYNTKDDVEALPGALP